MSFVETLSEKMTRQLAQRTSRRSLLGGLGSLLVGGAALPLLPVARAHADQEPAGYEGVAPRPPVSEGEEGSQTSCDYWRYCGIGGPLCACCGGSANACPPGTVMSPLSWIGTCLNPADDVYYIISYNDCCGKPTCKRCLCSPHDPNAKPPIRSQSSRAYLWCMGSGETTFTCSTSNVVGIAVEQK